MSTRRLLWGLVSWILISSLYVAARQSGETDPWGGFFSWLRRGRRPTDQLFRRYPVH
jgi:hypothetical protein